jgi:hypothetical protein
MSDPGSAEIFRNFFGQGGRGTAMRHVSKSKKDRLGRNHILVDRLPPPNKKSPFLFLRDLGLYRTLQTIPAPIIVVSDDSPSYAAVYLREHEPVSSLQSCGLIPRAMPAALLISKRLDESVLRHEMQHLRDVWSREDLFKEFAALESGGLSEKEGGPIQDFVFEQRAYVVEFNFIRTASSAKRFWIYVENASGEEEPIEVDKTELNYHRNPEIEAGMKFYAMAAGKALDRLKAKRSPVYVGVKDWILKNTPGHSTEFTPQKLIPRHFPN